MQVYIDTRGNKWLNFYFEDLTDEAKKSVIEALGDSGNFDIYPIASVPYVNTEIIDYHRFKQ